MNPEADAQFEDHALQSHVHDNQGNLEPGFAVMLNCECGEAFNAWQSFYDAAASDFELAIVATEVEPGRAISFTSPPDVSTAYSGQFRFDDATGRRGTSVTAMLHVDRTAGKLEKMFATWRGSDPALILRRDMRRLKQLIEAGEIATNAQSLAAAAQQKGIE